MTGFSMFLGILMGGSLGVGLAFLIFGSLLNRSNNHGDSLGENSRYTGGIAYSARIDKSLHKPAAQTEFLNTYYTPLYPDPVFKNPQAKVVRKMPAPQAPAMQANPAAPVSPQAAVTAAAAATDSRLPRLSRQHQQRRQFRQLRLQRYRQPKTIRLFRTTKPLRLLRIIRRLRRDTRLHRAIQPPPWAISHRPHRTIRRPRRSSDLYIKGIRKELFRKMPPHKR